MGSPTTSPESSIGRPRRPGGCPTSYWSRSPGSASSPAGSVGRLACAGSVWHLVSTPLARGDTSSVVYGLLAGAVPTVAVLVLTVFAVRAARRQSDTGASTSAPYLFGIGGWLLIAEALPDLDVLFRANVAAIGPAWGARLAILLIIGLGAGLAIGSFGLMPSRSKAMTDEASEVAAS